MIINRKLPADAEDRTHTATERRRASNALRAKARALQALHSPGDAALRFSDWAQGFITGLAMCQSHGLADLAAEAHALTAALEALNLNEAESRRAVPTAEQLRACLARVAERLEDAALYDALAVVCQEALALPGAVCRWANAVAAQSVADESGSVGEEGP